jgi:hypothetical protein
MVAAASVGSSKKPVSPFLGNSAKSIREKSPEARLSRFVTAKTIRYALQRKAGQLLWDELGGKRQKFRVCHCGRSVQGEGVAIYRQSSGAGARFGGLATCGSGWTCPTCATRIGEVRREELSKAAVKHVKVDGGRVNLLTQTFPHERNGLSLADTQVRFYKARQAFKNRALYKKLFSIDKTTIGYVGMVSSMEITHGANGWHPHLHMLSFTKRSLSDDEILELKKLWVSVLIKFGLGSKAQIPEMMEHGLDVRGGEDAAAYIAKYGREEKWGISSELTRSHSKKGIGDSVTPFGLLALADAGDEQAAALFVEFAHAFLGKRLITWSRGMRAKFGMQEEHTDEAAAAQEMEAEHFVAFINHDYWKIVLRADARAELLEYAAGCCLNPDTGQADIEEFIEALKYAPKKSRGWFYAPMRPKFFQ